MSVFTFLMLIYGMYKHKYMLSHSNIVFIWHVFYSDRKVFLLCSRHKPIKTFEVSGIHMKLS